MKRSRMLGGPDYGGIDPAYQWLVALFAVAVRNIIGQQSQGGIVTELWRIFNVRPAYDCIGVQPCVPAPDWPFIEDDDHGMFGGVLMSNADHEVNDQIAERMKTEQVLAEYTGWNFHAVCWFHDGKYHAEVSVYGVRRATISGVTPQDVMSEVSMAFGAD